MARISAITTLNQWVHHHEEIQYGRHIDAHTPAPPIFVLGAWRSGTTYLHNLLSQDPRLGFCGSLHVFNPHTFLGLEGMLRGRAAHLALEARQRFLQRVGGRPNPRWLRPDGVEAGAFLPQEDEFAMMMMGQSNMLSLFLPSLADRMTPYNTLIRLAPTQRERWKSRWLRFVRKISWFRKGRPLVLKSPAHTGRVATLLELFPQARFVHISRNPYQVVQSYIPFVTALQAQADALQSFKADVVGFVKNYREIYDAYLEQRSLIPSGQLAEIYYDDLVRDPIGQLLGIYEGLGLPDFAPVRSQVEAYVSLQERFAPRQHSRMAGDGAERLYQALRPVFEAFGYDSTPP